MDSLAIAIRSSQGMGGRQTLQLLWHQVPAMASTPIAPGIAGTGCRHDHLPTTHHRP